MIRIYNFEALSDNSSVSEHFRRIHTSHPAIMSVPSHNGSNDSDFESGTLPHQRHLVQSSISNPNPRVNTACSYHTSHSREEAHVSAVSYIIIALC